MGFGLGFGLGLGLGLGFGFGFGFGFGLGLEGVAHEGECPREREGRSEERDVPELDHL